jgi:hypothetical protein
MTNEELVDVLKRVDEVLRKMPDEQWQRGNSWEAAFMRTVMEAREIVAETLKMESLAQEGKR